MNRFAVVEGYDAQDSALPVSRIDDRSPEANAAFRLHLAAKRVADDLRAPFRSQVGPIARTCSAK